MDWMTWYNGLAKSTWTQLVDHRTDPANPLDDHRRMEAVRIEQRTRLAPRMRTPGLHEPLGDLAGEIALTERVPRESKKGFASDGISHSEISDLGECHTDRIPTLDVTGRLARI